MSYYDNDYDEEEYGGYGEYGDEEGYGYGGEEYGDDMRSEEEYGDEEGYGEEDEYEGDYETEVGAYGEGGRATMVTPGEGYEGELGALARIAGREAKTKAERFRSVVNAVSRSLQLDDASIQYMLSKTDKLRNIEYVNPVGFIIGYMATRDSTELESNKIKKAIEYSKKSPIENLKVNMTEPDVVRYARLWRSLK